LPAAAAPGLAPIAGLAVWAPAAAAGFAGGLPLVAVVGIVALASVALLGVPSGLPRTVPAERWTLAGLAAAAAALGVRWQAPLTGDALFHAGVVRKLVALPGLSLRAIWPFSDGHPHAGYAFPLLHTAQAGSVWLTAIDPSTAYRNMTPAFAAVAPLAAYPVGRALAGRSGGLYASLLTIWVGVSNGGLLSYGQQPRFVVTAIAVPALLLLLVHRRPEGRATTAAIAVTASLITILHVTYAAPVLIMIAAVAAAERAWPPLWASLLACGGVAAWVFEVSLAGAREHQYLLAPAADFLGPGGSHLALSGSQVFDNRPEFALADAGVAWLLWQHEPGGRRRLAIAAAAVLLLATLPGPTLLLQAVAGPGQAIRTWETIPAVLVLAVVLVRAPRLSGRSLAAAAAVSVAVSASDVMRSQVASAISTAAALAVVVALVARRVWRPPPPAPAGRVALAALALMAGPLAVTGWPVVRELWTGKRQTTASDVSPGLVAYMRAHDRGMPVVLAPYASGVSDNFAGTAYALVANADVYTVAESSAHTEAELLDQPIVRREQVTAFLSPSTTPARRHRILRRWDVSYVVAPISAASRPLLLQLGRDPLLRRVHTDPTGPAGELRFAIFRVTR
ncbi:MAG TPA: hypothetical protein VMU66_05905, partial [Gaiellales bacterium]|nr:hypothetical protein [Gaiellales bacterium]